ncbi:5-carboxymethyl-2-hydroxymuconate semialdehyde dehydrogenase [Trichinella spiralis]|uniref:5-carboxymethyl-2-hydroxymuconate semialdehyde dehydrogenase n=1 Tax=Trichinella spiralis TaxID=6334 RepID=A0ABR3KJN6_TRISP
MQKYMFIHKLRVDVAGLGQFSATGDIILPNGVCQMSSTWRVLTYATAPLYAVGPSSIVQFAQLFSNQQWSVPTCAGSNNQDDFETSSLTITIMCKRSFLCYHLCGLTFIIRTTLGVF